MERYWANHDVPHKMRGSPHSTSVIALIMATVAAAMIAFSCDRHRAPVSAHGPATAPVEDAESDLNHAVYPNTSLVLTRRPTAEDAPAEEGLEFDLIARMASDPDTQVTARGLYGVPVEFAGFVPGDAPPAEPLDAPPGAGLN